MIFGNTLNKWLMRTQDSDTTWKKFKELASTVSVAESANFGESDFMNGFQKENSAVIKEIDTIHFQDIVSQIEGEAHFFERGNVHKINTFYHGMGIDTFKTVSNRYNRLLSILPPSDKETDIISNYIKANASLSSSHSSNEIYPEIKPLTSDSPWNANVATFELFKRTITQFKETMQLTEEKTPISVTETSTNGTDNEVQSGKSDNSTAERQAASTNKKITKQVLDDVDKSIPKNNELTNKHNHWIFNQPNNADKDIASLLVQGLKDINNAIYGEDNDNLVSHRVIENIIQETSIALPYASIPSVQSKPNDIKSMWKHMDELTDDNNV